MLIGSSVTTNTQILKKRRRCRSLAKWRGLLGQCLPHPLRGRLWMHVRHVQTRHDGEARLRVRSCGCVDSLSHHRGHPSWRCGAPPGRSRLTRHDREGRGSSVIGRVGGTVAHGRSVVSESAGSVAEPCGERIARTGGVPHARPHQRSDRRSIRVVLGALFSVRRVPPHIGRTCMNVGGATSRTRRLGAARHIDQ
jgi:hypothetical protein